jgi:hypothetical protein
VNIEAGNAPSFETEALDPHDQIAFLESRLEELADSMARCRKIKLMSQIAMAGGGIWLMAVTVGIIGFDPMWMMAAVSGVIGGIVMYGSNMTTSQQVEAAIKDTEAQRAALIGRLDLRLVKGVRDAW